MPRRQSQATAAWVFGGVFALFLMGVFIFRPDDLSQDQQKILALIAASLVGFFGYFFTGSSRVVTEGSIPTVGKLAIRATGGVALFILILLWWNSPLAPVPPPVESPPVPVSELEVRVNGHKGSVRAPRGEPLVLRATWEYLSAGDSVRKAGRGKVHMIWQISPGQPFVADFVPPPQDFPFRAGSDATWDRLTTSPIPDGTPIGDYEVRLWATMPGFEKVSSNVVDVSID